MGNVTATRQGGWFKTMRSYEALELGAQSKNAFFLLYVIACRARWREGFNRHGLEFGEAFLGDFEKYGMSAREYRTAKHQLQKWGFATFKATNKGTIAKLTGTSVYDLTPFNDDKQTASQETGKRQATDRRPTSKEPLYTKETSKLTEIDPQKMLLEAIR